MDRPLSEGSDWFWIGFKFGVGFFLAATIFSAVGGWLAWVAMTHEMSAMTSQIDTSVRQIPAAPARAAAAAAPQLRTVHVPGQSKEECLKVSSGELNGEFLRCRSGYTYQTRD